MMTKAEKPLNHTREATAPSNGVLGLSTIEVLGLPWFIHAPGQHIGSEWSTHDDTVHQMGRYILDKVESKLHHRTSWKMSRAPMVTEASQ